MAFPAYGTEVPFLTAWQMEFHGQALGSGTILELTKLEGIDMPAVRSGDAGRPRDHGAFAGLDVMGEREITVSADLHSTETVTFKEAWEQAAESFVTSGSIQYPLFLNTPAFGTLATLVRLRKRQMPVDILFTLGNLAKVTLLFVGTDPRWYAPTQSASVTPPTSTAGFSFPLKFPFTFGGGGVAGALSVTNAGNIETRPLLIVEGPCENPSVTNARAPGSPNLTFDLLMNAGDRLVIDTDMHTATYYTAGTTVGYTRLYTLAQGSQWFTLEPGKSTIQFLSTSGEGQLTVQWASAWIL
jgi:hypothetical protein